MLSAETNYKLLRINNVLEPVAKPKWPLVATGFELETSDFEELEVISSKSINLLILLLHFYCFYFYTFCCRKEAKLSVSSTIYLCAESVCKTFLTVKKANLQTHAASL